MYIWKEEQSKHTSRYYYDYNQINNNKDMILSFIYYVILSKFSTVLYHNAMFTHVSRMDV